MPVRAKLDGLSQALQVIDVPDLGLSPDVAECSTDLLVGCRYIGSYNWDPDANRDNPTIIVPGSPNVWTNPQLPLVVPPDKGEHFRDYNLHILPEKPLLALLAAVDEQRIFDREDWKTVDFLTDRNGLRKLLRWISQSSGKSDFRIDTQLVGKKTVVLNRWEPVAVEYQSGNSYGFNFQKAVTEPALPGTQRSAWHHRIVTYKFGRFRMIVQFEVDGCLPRQQATSLTLEGQDDLANAMANLGLSSQTTSHSASPTSTSASKNPQRRSEVFGLSLRHQGDATIPQSSILEMSTRSSGGSVRWSDQYPQLYFSQAGNQFIGRHKEGKFHQINGLSLSSPELQRVNAQLQPAFRKLEEALRRIQSLVVEHGKEERLSLVYEKPNLTVHKNLDNPSCLPPEALALFD